MKKQLLIICAMFLLTGGMSYSQTPRIFGITSNGGAHNQGTIFKMNLDGTGFTTVYSFAASTGFDPEGGELIKAPNNKLYGMCRRGGTNSKGCLFSFDPISNTYTDIINFNGPNGAFPEGNLILAPDGMLYGLTTHGGTHDAGILFKFNPNTNFGNLLWEFDVATGGTYPESTLLLGTDGKLYGTTANGGTGGYGTIFRFNLSNNVYSVLYDMGQDIGNDRLSPYGGLVQSRNGWIYGEAINNVIPGPSEVQVFRFNPISNALARISIQSTQFENVLNRKLMKEFIVFEELYGLSDTHPNSFGKIFKILPSNNTYQEVYDFGDPNFNSGINGAHPVGGLAYASLATYFGVTKSGGTKDSGVIFRFISGAGGGYKKLHDFTGNAGGAYPIGNLTILFCTTAPATPSTISVSGGSAAVCPGDVRTYSVSFISNNTYSWTAPAGATITSGQGSSSIQVTFTSGFTANGVLSVKANNSCGTSAARNLTITRSNNPPPQPGTITVSGGSAAVCPGDTRIYTVTNIPGVAYHWALPTGAIIAVGPQINHISVSFNSGFTVPGNLSVYVSNGCGASPVRTLLINRNTPPPLPGVITGNNIVCAGSTRTYSVPAITGATTYTWAVPSGAVIKTGQGSRSISVMLGSTSGNVSVYASNGCGNSDVRTKAVNILICFAAQQKPAMNKPDVGQLKTTANTLNAEIFPNPTNGKVTVKFKGTADEKYKLMVNDITGRLIINEEGKSKKGTNLHEIDLSHHTKGMYIINLETTDYSKQVKLILK